MQYGPARVQLELAAGATTSTRDERREIAHLSALVWAAEGQLEKAEAVYGELLAADPSAPAPQQAPPRLREAFRKIKERLYPQGFVTLTERHAPPGRVAVAVVDPWSSVAALTLFEEGQSGLTERPLRPDEFGVAVESFSGTSRGWFVEARDASGALRAQLGSRQAPRLLAAPPTAQASLLPTAAPARSRVLPWLATGLAVGMAGATAGIAASGSDTYGRAGTAVFASDRLAFDQRARTEFSVSWGLGVGALVIGAVALALWLW
jgi:hypothetical protein